VWRFQTELPPCLDPPVAACSPSPPNNKSNANRDSNLAWSCGDSRCDKAVTYDVYFGTSADLGDAQKQGTVSTKSFALSRLNAGTKYYWKIITKDANGTTSSPVWSFTVKS
jgi:fibronectin type 3 domain-containing protein